VGEREDKEGVKVYEAYGEKQKRGKLRCLLLRRKKIFFFIFMKSLLGNFLKNGPLFTTNDGCRWMAPPSLRPKSPTRQGYRCEARVQARLVGPRATTSQNVSILVYLLYKAAIC